MAKMKNKSYHNTHQILTGNLLFVRNKAIQFYFEDALDDVAKELESREPIRLFLIELKQKVHNLIEKAVEVRKHVTKMTVF